MLKTALLVGIALTLNGCVSSKVEQLMTAPAGQIMEGESIVVLGRRQNFRHQTEADFTDCVYNALLRRYRLPVKPEEQFMDEMFPWFQPRTAPRDQEALAQLLQNPALAARLQEIGTRYVVWLDGVTSRTDDGGTMSCSVGPGGGGCLGLVWWENEAVYEASVWDMASVQTMGKITVDASGTSWVPAVILPIPLIAPTQSAACSGVARQIQEFLLSPAG